MSFWDSWLSLVEVLPRLETLELLLVGVCSAALVAVLLPYLLELATLLPRKFRLFFCRCVSEEGRR